MKSPVRFFITLLFTSAVVILIGSCAERAFFRPSNAGYAPYNGTVVVLDALPDSTSYTEIGSFYSNRVAVKRVARTIDTAKRISAENGADALVILKNEKKENMDIICVPTSQDAFIMIPVFDTHVIFSAKAIKLKKP